MAWIKAYFDGFQILSALCWPPCSSRSRLSESHSFQANTSDDRGSRDREMAEKRR